MDIIAIVNNIYQSLNIYKAIIFTSPANIIELVASLCELDYPAVTYSDINKFIENDARILVISDKTGMDELYILVGINALSQITAILYYNCGYPIINHQYYKNKGCVNLSHVFIL